MESVERRDKSKERWKDLKRDLEKVRTRKRDNVREDTEKRQ